MASPNPVVAREVEVRVHCPVELERSLSPMPVPADDAVLTHNDAGGRYFDAIIGWAVEAVGLFNDAKAACPATGDQ